MANNKTGFEYYSVETNRYLDIRIKRLKKSFGCNGIAVYDYILSGIYRDKGCFVEWDENTAFDVAEYFGIKESLVNEIVNYCCAVGLFSKELLASERILTSQSIQKRYLEMCTRAKRINSTIPERVKIREVCPKLTEECTKLTEVCDKGKESKEKKVNKPPPRACEDFSFLPEELRAALDVFFAIQAEKGNPVFAAEQEAMIAKLLSATGSDFAKAKAWVENAIDKRLRYIGEPIDWKETYAKAGKSAKGTTNEKPPNQPIRDENERVKRKMREEIELRFGNASEHTSGETETHI